LILAPSSGREETCRICPHNSTQNRFLAALTASGGTTNANDDHTQPRIGSTRRKTNR